MKNRPMHPDATSLKSSARLTDQRSNLLPVFEGLVLARAAPRCGASTRSGGSCRAPAVKGKKRCRMHGGGRGSGGQLGNRNAVKSGCFTAEAIEMRKEIALLGRLARELCEKA